MSYEWTVILFLGYGAIHALSVILALFLAGTWLPEPTKTEQEEKVLHPNQQTIRVIQNITLVVFAMGMILILPYVSITYYSIRIFHRWYFEQLESYEQS